MILTLLITISSRLFYEISDYQLPGVPWQEPNCRMDQPTAGHGSGTEVTPIQAG